MTKAKPQTKQYDVCLSFAGEDRKYVNLVAKLLDARGVRVFYDKYDQANLWGKDLFEHLDFIYGEAASYCVMFVSKAYAQKLWTNHERQSAQARALKGRAEYILPARFDSTTVPGLRATIGYVDLRKLNPKGLADLIVSKLSPLRLLEFQQKENYVPPTPDKLYLAMRARRAAFKSAIKSVIWDFESSLARMTASERKLVLQLYLNGCTHSFVKDMHYELDLLRRISGFPAAEIEKLLSGISALGFTYSIKSKSLPILHVAWHGRNAIATIELETHHSSDNAVASTAVRVVGANYCEEHALDTLMRCNFSALATNTTTVDSH